MVDADDDQRHAAIRRVELARLDAIAEIVADERLVRLDPSIARRLFEQTSRGSAVSSRTAPA